jgi:ABC-2 type transport system permease protein
MNTTRKKILDTLHIVWTIASKDIVDALRNKLVISLILGTGFMLLMPKAMGLVLDPPYTPVLVYDPGSSRLTAELETDTRYQVRQASSISELQQVIGSAGFGLGTELGLVIPTGFDQVLEAGGQLELDGYVAWANRAKAAQLKADFEGRFADLLGQPVRIDIEGKVVYPPPGPTLALGISTWTAVIVILIMGVNLVPNLVFEEKQTKTMEALLVSPASIGQVVVGKALAGLFYMLVTAGVVFAINWTGVVHWEVAALFVLSSGLFAVAVGLVLGSFFERQQDVVGPMMLLIVIFVASIFVDMVELELPTFIRVILPWVPSVALAEVIRFVFLESIPWPEIGMDLGSVLGISAFLYAIVVWQVRRSDR